MGDVLVTIASFHSPVEAHLARTVIESFGIECFIADENIVTLKSYASHAFGGAKLKVREEDAERAIVALKSNR